MQIDLTTEYAKMADLLSVSSDGLQLKVQVISGTVLVTETMEAPEPSSNFGFTFGKTQVFTSTGAGGDLYIRGTSQYSRVEVTVSAGDFNAGISPFNGGSGGGGSSSGTTETPASIKQKYESNPDTNPFTDAEQTAVQELINSGGSTGVSNVEVTYNSSSKVAAVVVDGVSGSAVLTGVSTESYADSKSNEAITTANAYTDQKISEIPGGADTYSKQEIDSKDQDTLNSANTNTQTEITKLSNELSTKLVSDKDNAANKLSFNVNEVTALESDKTVAIKATDNAYLGIIESNGAVSEKVKATKTDVEINSELNLKNNQIKNAADAVDDSDTPNLAQVKTLISQSGGGGGSSNPYPTSVLLDHDKSVDGDGYTGLLVRLIMEGSNNLISNRLPVDFGGSSVVGNNLDISYKRLTASGEELILTDLHTLNNAILLKQNIDDGKVEIPVFGDTQSFVQSDGKSETLTNPEFVLRGVVGQDYYMIDTDFPAYVQYAELPNADVVLEIFRDDESIFKTSFAGTATGVASEINLPKLFISSETPIKIKLTLSNGQDLLLAGENGLPYFAFSYKPYTLKDIAAASSSEGNPVTEITHNVNSEGLETTISLNDGTQINSNRVVLEASDNIDLTMGFRAIADNMINANSGVCYSYKESEPVVRQYDPLFDVSLMGIATETRSFGEIKIATRGVFDVINLNLNDRVEGEFLYYGDDNMLGFSGGVGANELPIGLYLGGAKMYIDVDVYNRAKDISKAQAASEFDVIKANMVQAVGEDDNFLSLNLSGGTLLQSSGQSIYRSDEKIKLEIGLGGDGLEIDGDSVKTSKPLDLSNNVINNLADATESHQAVPLTQVRSLIADAGGSDGSGSGDVSWVGDTSENAGKIIVAESDDGKNIRSIDLTAQDIESLKTSVEENKSSIEEVDSSLAGILESVTQNTNRVGSTEEKLTHREFAQVSTLGSLSITQEQINAASNKKEISQIFFDASVTSADHHRYILRLNIANGNSLNNFLPNSSGGLLIVTSAQGELGHRLRYDFIDDLGAYYFASMPEKESDFIDFIKLESKDLTEIEEDIAKLQRDYGNITETVNGLSNDVSANANSVVLLNDSLLETNAKLQKVIDVTYDRPHLDQLSDLGLTDESFAAVDGAESGLRVFLSAAYQGGVDTWEITLKVEDAFHGMLPEQGGVVVIQRFNSLLHAYYTAESGKVYSALISSTDVFYDWVDITASGGSSELEARVSQVELDITAAQEMISSQSTLIDDNKGNIELLTEELDTQDQKVDLIEQTCLKNTVELEYDPAESELKLSGSTIRSPDLSVLATVSLKTAASAIVTKTAYWGWSDNDLTTITAPEIQDTLSNDRGYTDKIYGDSVEVFIGREATYLRDASFVLSRLDSTAKYIYIAVPLIVDPAPLAIIYNGLVTNWLHKDLDFGNGDMYRVFASEHKVLSDSTIIKIV